MPRQAPKLQEKHWQALSLIDEGKTSLKEIASSLGWQPNSLYWLYEGNVEKMGKTALLFQSEVKKLSAKQVSKIKDLVRDNKVLALRMMNEFLRRKSALEYQSDEEIELITTVFNALAKATPSIEINSTSYSYVKGLSAEELLHEYNKLRTLAEGASVRPGVPSVGSRSTRVLSVLDEPGSGAGEESEDTDV